MLTEIWIVIEDCYGIFDNRQRRQPSLGDTQARIPVFLSASV